MSIKRYTAIVVDDDIDALESLYEYLSVKFAKVYKACNGAEALQLCNKVNPDIVFTDLEMPKMHGLEFIESLRYVKKDIPIVIISAYDDTPKMQSAIRFGVVDYIIKPVKIKELKSAVESSIQKLDSLDILEPLRDGYFWNIGKLQLLHNNKVQELSLSESKALQILVARKNTPVDSVDIYYHIWDDYEKEHNPRSIRNIISKLRNKIPVDGLIRNIYGSKYQLVSKP